MFSQIFVPQSLVPLCFMLCSASLCKHNSSESCPMMLSETGEHMANDLRLFLHTEPLQNLQTLWTVLFSSSHRFAMGFRSGD